MHKMWAYWKVKISWFIYVYATIQITLTVIDYTWISPLIIYSCGLFYICDYYQTTINFSSNEIESTTYLNQLLPVKKQEYCIAQSGFIVSFVIGNIILFLIVGILRDNRIVNGYDVLFLVIIMTFIYAVFHVYQVWYNKISEKNNQTRIFLLISMILFICIVLIIVPSARSYTSDAVFVSRFGILMVGWGSLILVVRVILEIRKKMVEKDDFVLNMKNPRASIIKLVNLRYGRKIELWSSLGIGNLLVNIFNYSDNWSVFVCGLISILILLVVGISLITKIYDSNHYLKLLPISRQQVFKYMLQTWLLRWFVGSGSVIALYCGLVLFRSGDFNWTLTSGDFLYVVMMHALTLLLIIKGYFSTVRGFFLAGAITVGILIAIFTQQILIVLNQYTIAAWIAIIFIAQWGVQRMKVNYRKQVFK